MAPTLLLLMALAVAQASEALPPTTTDFFFEICSSIRSALGSLPDAFQRDVYAKILQAKADLQSTAREEILRKLFNSVKEDPANLDALRKLHELFKKLWKSLQEEEGGRGNPLCAGLW